MKLTNYVCCSWTLGSQRFPPNIFGKNMIGVHIFFYITGGADIKTWGVPRGVYLLKANRNDGVVLCQVTTMSSLTHRKCLSATALLVSCLIKKCLPPSFSVKKKSGVKVLTFVNIAR